MSEALVVSINTAERRDALPRTAQLAGGVNRGPDAGATAAPPASGATHSSEIEYALGNLATNKVYAWTDDDYKVSRTMEEYFANFIKTGDPNGSKLPQWPAANSDKSVPVMNIDVETRVEPEKHRERYEFLDSLNR
jgi:para-nitrobenzyl esterase